MEYKRTILRRLMQKEKFFLSDLKRYKEIINYLNYLVEKKVLKFNEEYKFYVANYEARIDPFNCPYIKLKYFYYWKFPPKYKDEEIPGIKISSLLRTIFEHNGINFEVLPEEKEEYQLLRSRGFIIEDEEEYEHFFGIDRIKRILTDEKMISPKERYGRKSPALAKIHVIRDRLYENNLNNFEGLIFDAAITLLIEIRNSPLEITDLNQIHELINEYKDISNKGYYSNKIILLDNIIKNAVKQKTNKENIQNIINQIYKIKT